MRYRKKPVEIEAHQFVDEPTGEFIAHWCGGQVSAYRSMSVDGIRTSAAPYIAIQTLEGQMRADLGDYVIRGVAGEFYPCKPDIFEATYEPVKEGCS